MKEICSKYNIEINLENIDEERVIYAARQAQISGEIESWEKKYRTVVGERGVCISGGQRQRIGIARAFYKQADVIIFDEATSALDIKTEAAVMKAVSDLHTEYTMLIVAHRLSTLEVCDVVVELKDGEIIRVASYNEMVG